MLLRIFIDTSKQSSPNVRMVNKINFVLMFLGTRLYTNLFWLPAVRM